MIRLSYVFALLLSLIVVSSSDASIKNEAERLLSHHHHSSDDMSMSMVMSMPSSKGKGEKKGKGTSGSSASSKGKGSSSVSAKGSGKGNSISSSSKGNSVSSSSKGNSKGKSSSNSKSSKKSSKSSKKGSTTAEPTPAPTGPVNPATPSPTSENSIPIRATPFALFYEGDFDRIPSDDEYASVAEITRVYLEMFFEDEFAQTSLTNLDDFLTFMIRNQFENGLPVQADYRCTGLFNPSSIFLPTVRELNSLITEAFTDDRLDDYINRLQTLPRNNIFSSTSGVGKGLPSVPVPRSASAGTASSGGMKVGLAAAAAGIVVLAAGAAMMKRQGGNEIDGLEDPYGENLKEDAETLAGDSCDTSVDGSSTTWRKSSPYITNTSVPSHGMDESEFIDEPLDSDEEYEAHVSKSSRQKRRGQRDPSRTQQVS